MPISASPTPRLSLSAYEQGIRQGRRDVLSRAITLVESKLESDRATGEALIQALLPATGQTMRIGITGAPGVGKSSFIEVFGKYLTARSKKVAVLTLDPGGRRSKGSILGDKTRMETLSRDPNAFIRPTSAGEAAGGVHSRTREVMLLCEAAGFDVIIVETVGVGQSETAVHEMVDFFMLLLLGGAGDELQGIKRGIMEMADGLVITKADGPYRRRAREAQLNYRRALHFFPASPSGWRPNVLLSSAAENKGMAEIWESIVAFRAFTSQNGALAARRHDQKKAWLYAALDEAFRHEIMHNAPLNAALKALETDVTEGRLLPPQAARHLLGKLERARQRKKEDDETAP